jgi:beta-galactosidase
MQRTLRRTLPVLLVLMMGAGAARAGDEKADTVLPRGVKAVWDLSKAHRETTPTRERICLNGLWRWQPARETDASVPRKSWGYFKVPGFWPGNNNYIQEDSQILFAHPDWKRANVSTLTAAWYEREFTVPENWTGRRIALAAEYVNSFAIVYVDGKKAGELRFPADQTDITALCKPGSKHVVSLLVLAMPLRGVLLSYSDTNSAREVKGSVDRRGLCGDVYLVSTPAAGRITDIKIDTSYRKKQATFHVVLAGLDPRASYTLRVKIEEKGRELRQVESAPFRLADLTNGRVSVLLKDWLPERLWDTHTPENMLDAQVTLLSAKGEAVDASYPVRFGFREFWIEGRDFYLNGTRIYLSAVPLDNAQIGARTASYAGARETMKRLRSFGINFVYTHNYGCQPGSHVSFAEVLRAADDEGMLMALSQPHFGHYDWKAADADQANGYARHAAFYVGVAGNHPSVVAYSMSHNSTGYGEDMNPNLIDGLRDPRTSSWSINNAKRARRAEAIVKKLDPGRIVYHHSSGNLGSMHTCNFYVNFVPIQEMSDWFGHWASKGVKPVFLVEYGVPFAWDWTMYRGWYKGERAFGSARVPWEFCLAEWNAQFLGDRAYQISDREKQNLRWEARQFRAGKLWHRWDYPTQVGAAEFDERQPIFARYITDNWRAFRTWGLSANSPWQYHVFWKLKPGVDKGRQEFAVDWDDLEKPGFSPDYTQRRSWQMATDFKPSDWQATESAQALIRNNRPLLAYLAGKPGNFTSKDHNFIPGEVVEKQLILINNSRETVTCSCDWKFELPEPMSGSKKVTLPTGQQERLPLRFTLPAMLPVGKYQLNASVRFSNGEVQRDSCTINVLPPPPAVETKARIALFDPKGETSKRLKRLEVPFKVLDPTKDLSRVDYSAFDVLIIGKDALTPEGPGPAAGLVELGQKVIVFEQSAKVLEQRFGFRVAEYGLRQVFPRVPDHPLLAGLAEGHLHDWRGEATILPPQLTYRMRPRYGPTVTWCGIDVPRVWRCGCRGNVASVLIEKPARGDFLPILEGGYALQYSPLLEFREGKGLVLFCQMDVTGRTEADPAAERLVGNLIRYVSAWKPTPRRQALYVGEAEGKAHLQAAGFSPVPYTRDALTADGVLIVGPGGGKKLAGDTAAIERWLRGGGHLLAIGLDQDEAGAFLPYKIAMKQQEHIATTFAPPPARSLLAGIAPADVHNRDPRRLPLISGGAVPLGNGVLAKVEDANVVFCQLVPWHFKDEKQMNLRRTFRRTSCLVTRLLSNMGVEGGVDGRTPLLARFSDPVDPARPERRWLESFYLDVPEEWDDPYRFFRW